MQRWFEIHPRTAAYAVWHYIPLTRNLRVPGMTAIAAPRRPVLRVAPAAGRHTLWASEPLVRHPWFTKPLDYARVQGPLATRYAILLEQLPPARVGWVDDDVLALIPRSFEKRCTRDGFSRENRPVGVVVVPAGRQTLATATAEEFQF